MRLLLSLLFCSVVAQCAYASTQPNIVLMLVDDMGVMDSSVPFLTDATGKPQRYPLNDYYRTPNMERLAQRGIRFSQFCAMSVCSPTRISVMTGQNAARHRTTNWINPNVDNGGPNGPADWNWTGLKPGDVTLPALLRTAGYRTIHVGKGHFAPSSQAGSDPSQLGFDINVGGSSIGAPGSYYGTDNFGGKPRPNAKGKATAAVPGLAKYHGKDIFLTEALTEEAKLHMSAAAEEKKPFFLYFAQYAVHSPHKSDPRYAPNYTASGKSAPAQNFATLIEGMDKSLGDLMDHLDAKGLAEDTLILFLGDNGSDAPLGHEHAVACAAPLRGKKGSHYEGGTRVPFLAAWAKANTANPHQHRLPIPQGSVQTQQAAVQDILPTLLSLAQLSSPAGHPVDGKPLTKLLSGSPDPTRTERFLMHYPHSPHRSSHFTVLRDGQWKVIYHYFPSEQSSGSAYQLFNLKSDPFEQQDLATTQPAELRRMMELLIGELDAARATYPVRDGAPLRPVLP
jgi:arylsulfatase A-like enzyme